jgi:hypothetical protein
MNRAGFQAFERFFSSTSMDVCFAFFLPSFRQWSSISGAISKWENSKFMEMASRRQRPLKCKKMTLQLLDTSRLQKLAPAAAGQSKMHFRSH